MSPRPMVPRRMLDRLWSAQLQVMEPRMTLASLARRALIAARTRCSLPPAQAQTARQGLVRHQLGRRGRAWRLLSGGRRRHLQEIRPRRHHRAGRPAGEQPPAAARRQDRLLHERATRCRASTRSAQNIPTIVVAAIFQKEPQVLLAHPGQGVEKFEDLKKATLFVSSEGHAELLQVDAGRVRLRAREGEALHVQSRSRSWSTSRARCRAM